MTPEQIKELEAIIGNLKVVRGALFQRGELLHAGVVLTGMDAITWLMHKLTPVPIEQPYAPAKDGGDASS